MEASAFLVALRQECEHLALSGDRIGIAPPKIGANAASERYFSVISL
jgi:hypothetical protein